MAKNDVVVRTATDLERKYNLGSIGGMKKNIEITAQGIQELQNELYKILTTLVINLKDILDSQSEISLWFYSGIPTTKNEPYTNWTTPSDHIGDIYYDQSSGYVYQYKEVDGAGIWESNVSPDLVEAMAITNSELDTATDHERRVFFDTPVIPYSNGDWWVKEDGSLFICQLSKTTGIFEENDFISSNNYTESIAEKLGDEIKVLKGTITQISENFAKFTDLATGKSTTISGDNITSGSLQSNNYINNVSGTKLSLDDGTIDTKNFKVDVNGNVTCNDANINGSAILNGSKFNLDAEGNLTCNGAKINGSAIVNGTKFGVDAEGNVNCSNINVTGGNINLVGDTSQSKFKVTHSGDSNWYTELLPNWLRMWKNSNVGVQLAYTVDTPMMQLTDGTNTTYVRSDVIITPVLTQTSLESAKKDFEKLDNGLDIIKNTDIYKYHLKSQNDEDKKHIGFVIGKNYKYREEITSQNNDGADLYSMISVCFKAIQEQQEMIDLLKEEIKNLKEG